ncbi:MAG: hypothetical protein ACU0A6_06120 [Shimia sp.]|uniref:hypothetical protein n=1 Tax=Shimia sp. TaxID=1954381 RepID=UPI004058C0F4
MTSCITSVMRLYRVGAVLTDAGINGAGVASVQIATVALDALTSGANGPKPVAHLMGDQA